MQKTRMFAPIPALVVVLLEGYLTLQSEGISKGFLFDFAGVPSILVPQRYPWEIQLAALLLGFVAVVAYRKVAIDERTKIVVLGTLVAAAILSMLFYGTVHSTRTNLFAMTLINGGTSPMTLGFIAAVSADAMRGKAGAANVRRRPAAYQRGWIASRKYRS
ncbi:hypothetical protein ACIPY2_17730 [Paenarthrobacter sp. NPDC089675]|uniref:hypothetical protein n=1 Tax=Paenarthrobacter sp. NPDC089675 TaxID=3364376 RepID=UPI00382E7829